MSINNLKIGCFDEGTGHHTVIEAPYILERRINLGLWETAHLPLPYANINAQFSLRAKCWLRGRVVGQFLGNLNRSGKTCPGQKGPLPTRDNKGIKLTAKTVDEDPASYKRWISRKEI